MGSAQILGGLDHLIFFSFFLSLVILLASCQWFCVSFFSPFKNMCAAHCSLEVGLVSRVVVEK